MTIIDGNGDDGRRAQGMGATKCGRPTPPARQAGWRGCGGAGCVGGGAGGRAVVLAAGAGRDVRAGPAAAVVPAPLRRLLLLLRICIAFLCCFAIAGLTGLIGWSRYEWNVNQHAINHYTSSVRHSMLTSTGSVVIQNGVGTIQDGEFGRELVSGIRRVRTLDSPKEPCQRLCTPEGVCDAQCAPLSGRAPLRDVLAALPSPERPAIAEIAVSLTTANFGHNRIHAFAHASGRICVDVERRNATGNATYIDQDCTPPYDDVSGMLSAVLAPLSSSQSVLRDVDLRPVSRAGEWQEILGDFYLLPEELGSGQDRMTLFLKLGSPLATIGSASLTDLTLTDIPFENVALGKEVISRQAYVGTKSIVASNAAENDGRVTTVLNAQLTNGVTEPDAEEIWFFVDNNSPPVTLEFEMDLVKASFVCSVQIAWVENGHISDWTFLVSTSTGVDDFEPVVQVNTANAGSRLAVGSTDNHWFPCVSGVRRAKLHLETTDNHVFMLTEIAVHGYVEAVYGMCQTRCRHGGRCMFAQNPACECVQKWGWRGPDCATDVDECDLEDGDELATALSVFPPYGGCGEGDTTTATCMNLDATFQCHCKDGYSGISVIGSGNECADINECYVDNGGCQHICNNQQGTYSCSCNAGYILNEDGMRCDPHCSRQCEHGSLCLESEQCFGCDPGWQGQYCHEPSCQIQIETIDDYGMWITMTRCYHDGDCQGVDNCINCPGGWAGPKCEEVPGGLTILIMGLVVGLGLILPTLGMVWSQRFWVPLQERGIALLCISGGSALIFCVTAPAASNPLGYGIPLVVTPVQPENRFWEVWLPYTVAYGLWFNCLFIRVHNLYLIHLRATVPFSLALQIPVLWVPWILASSLYLQAPPECLTAPGAVNTPGLCVVDDSSTIEGLQRTSCEGAGDGNQCVFVSAQGRALFPQLTHIAWLAMCSCFMTFFIRDSRKLLPLFREIPDLLPNIVFGFLSLMAVMAMHVLRLVGYDYSNPNGQLNIIIPGVLISLLALHAAITQTRLVYKATKKDVATLAKYTREGDKGSDESSSASDSEDEAKTRAAAKGRWKGIGRAKGMAMVRLSNATIEKLARSHTPSSTGGSRAVTPLTTMLEKRERAKRDSWDDVLNLKRDDVSQTDESETRSEDSTPSSPLVPPEQLDEQSNKHAEEEEQEEEEGGQAMSKRRERRRQDKNPNSGDSAVVGLRGGRGGSRGGGRSRGKTVRGSRGGAVRGSSAVMTSGGVQVSAAKTGRIIDALVSGQLTAEEAKTKLGVPPPKKKELSGPTDKQQQIRKVATLFTDVKQLLQAAEDQDPTQPRPRRGSKDSFDTSSDEEEHAMIEQEVEKFAAIVGKSVDVCICTGPVFIMLSEFSGHIETALFTLAALQMPGYVPQFYGKEIGDTFDKHAQMGMDMSVRLFAHPSGLR